MEFASDMDEVVVGVEQGEMRSSLISRRSCEVTVALRRGVAGEELEREGVKGEESERDGENGEESEKEGEKGEESERDGEKGAELFNDAS